MSTNKTKNGKSPFQSKLDLETLQDLILKKKKTPAEIMSDYDIKSYTLKSKLFDAATADPKNAVHYCIAVPSEVSNRIERKKSLTIPSALCNMLAIEHGTKFDVSQDTKGRVILTPLKK
jgi:hypothetical protein